jgi:hypothetical protein
LFTKAKYLQVPSYLLFWCKRANSDAAKYLQKAAALHNALQLGGAGASKGKEVEEAAGMKFTCFTGKTVQILTLRRASAEEEHGNETGTQFTCFTGTEGQILTLRTC